MSVWDFFLKVQLYTVKNRCTVNRKRDFKRKVEGKKMGEIYTMAILYLEIRYGFINVHQVNFKKKSSTSDIKWHLNLLIFFKKTLQS